MKNNRGFTLIELMIAVVIVAILAAVAFPTYQNSVRKSRRAEAKIALLEVAQILERCFTEFNVFVGPPSQCRILTDTDADTFGDSFTAIATNLSPFNGQGYYTISIPALTFTGTTYLITATPTTKGRQDKDTQCASYTLDNTGIKDAFNSSAASTRDICWQ